MIRKLICSVLILCLVLSCVPFAALAGGQETCSHHDHDETCTASGSCTFVCETCVAEVKRLVDLLPGMYEISADNKETVIAQLEAIDKAKLGLSDAARELIDWKKYDEAAFVCDTPPDCAAVSVSKRIAPENVGLAADPVFRFLDAEGEPATIRHGENQVSAISITPNAETKYVYIPAGTYTVDETVEGEWHMSLTVNGVAQKDATISCQAGDVNAVVIENTSTFDIPVTVIWDDANNQDGKRPDSVTVMLWADSVEPKSQTVSADEDGNWSYTFRNLPVLYSNGVKVEYKLNVEKVDGYSSTPPYLAADGFTVIMKHTPELVNVSGTIIWDDANDQDGKRSGVQLEIVLWRADGNGEKKQGATKKLDTPSVETTSNYKFNNLPKYYDGGQEYKYTIEAHISGTNAADYTATVEGLQVTVTHVPETTSVTGTITWDDGNNQDGKRPESVTVKLLADGTETDSRTVSADQNGDWTFAFTDLPKYKNGAEIRYQIIQAPVSGYEPDLDVDGYNIAYSYTPETVSVSGTVTWDDNNDQDGKRPEQVTLDILANGTGTSSVTVTAADNWSYSVTGLPKNSAGQPVAYTVKAQPVAGYIANADGTAISLSHTPETVSVSGTVTWDDANDQDGKRPEKITVEVLADGTRTDAKTVEADPDGNWSYSFQNLPKYKAGKQIAYTVAVQPIEGYTVKVDGENITATPIADPAPPETEGTTPPETEGTTPPETEGTTPPETEGTTPPETEGTTPPETESTAPPAGDSTNPSTGDVTNLLLPLVILTASAILLADTALRKRKTEN